MTELPLNIQRAIRRYEPINSDGLTFYPILVKEYEEFLIAKPALEVMQQSFPVTLMRMPLLAALYQMDFQTAIKNETPTGLFSRALLVLALSLRLGEGREIKERLEMFRISVERDKPEKLTHLEFTLDDGKTYKITPTQFNKARTIIAAQNGVRLESDMANPDIVQAQKNMCAESGLKLDANIDSLRNAAAALCHADEAEIDEWPILKLNNRTDAWRLMLDYIVCGVGEANGTTWKSGNPVPHPFFKRLRNGEGLFSKMDSTIRNTGAVSTKISNGDIALPQH